MSNTYESRTMVAEIVDIDNDGPMQLRISWGGCVRVWVLRPEKIKDVLLDSAERFESGCSGP